MVGAGLLVRSLQNLKNFYPGFRTDNVLLFDVNARLLGTRLRRRMPCTGG